MVEFKFIEYGTDFGTRDMGQKLREKILALINGEEKVVLDFTGVNVVSNSFADECIAKLLLEMLIRLSAFQGSKPSASYFKRDFCTAYLHQKVPKNPELFGHKKSSRAIF